MDKLDLSRYVQIDYEKTPKVLEVKDLKVSFKSDEGVVHAIRGVSFDLYRGETLCLVGESGCGKSTVCKTLMGILSNEAVVEGGSALFEGEDLTKISEDEFHRIRGDKIGMIFQDPLSSLNPIMKVGKQIVEATLINRNVLKKKYESLIAKELIAYKNAKTEYTQGRHRLLSEPEFYYADAKKAVSDRAYEMKKEGVSHKEVDAFTKEELSQAKRKKKEMLSKNKGEIALLKKAYKEKKPALIAALKARRKEARVELKAYAEQLKRQYAQERDALDAKIASASSQEEKEALHQERQKIRDAYTAKTRITRRQAKEMALAVMREVGINNPEERFKQYPFEFSGGMRQRIVIAIALTANPQVLICDEPTTALDVTIQAQILELINKLKKDRKMSIVFITHDLGVVANMADRIAVMYAGKIVEAGTSYEVFCDPKHPYTWALLSSIPDVNSKERLVAIPGTPPNLVTPPKGDAFAERNQYALDIDYEHEPPVYELSKTHWAATWLLHEKAPKVELPKIVETRIEKTLEREVAHERQRERQAQ